MTEHKIKPRPAHRRSVPPSPKGEVAAGRRKARRSAELVDEVMAFVRRYVVMTDAQHLVVGLYIVHTHLVGACQQTPYLSISSPERGCGKSRLMEVLELLVARPWMIVNPSEAVLFRQVSKHRPTLLWDEIDTVFAPRTAQYHEGHRALLDQGHRRFGRVPRFIGDDVVEFSVFCAKVLAGIGSLPDTIASRSIPIRLQRRKSDEPISRFIRRDVEPEAQELAGRLNDWAEEHAEKIEHARPEMPSELDDRMQEGCESLVAIAELMGCGESARAALVELLNVERIDSQETMRLRLLRDVRRVCEEMGVGRAVPTETLLEGLWRLPESPWSEQRYYGRNLDNKDLSDLLSHYGAKPQPVKVGNGETKRGYRLADHTTRDGQHITGLAVAWQRYTDGPGGNG
jgi:hypothetical protein